MASSPGAFLVGAKMLPHSKKCILPSMVMVHRKILFFPRPLDFFGACDSILMLMQS